MVALGLPQLPELLLGKLRWDDPSNLLFRLALAWAGVLLLIFLIRFWERQPLGSIGLRPLSKEDARFALRAFAIGVAVFVLTAPLLQAFGLGTANAGIAQVAQAPLWLRILIVLTAGIREEILFRGYPIERLNGLTGNLWLAATIGYGLFVVLHLPLWGVGGTVQIGLWSLVITWLYVRRRNLYACMLMHVLNDGFAFIVVPLFMG